MTSAQTECVNTLFQRNGELEAQLSEARDREVKLKAEIENLKKLAMQDPLTKLPNRRALDLYSEHIWGHVSRHNGDLPETYLLMIDLNGFKGINDKFGHAVGDQALIKVADVLKSAIRAEDFLARFAGDEFVIIAEGNGVVDLNSKLKEAVNQMHVNANELTKLCGFAISVGYAQINKDLTFAEVLEQADKAMYEDKQNK